MTPYIILLSFILLLGIIYYKFDFKYKNLCICLLVTLILIVMSSIRWKVGYDFGSYATGYYNLVKVSIYRVASHYWEKGYVLLNTAVAYFSKTSYIPFFVVTSIMIFGGLGYLINRDSDNVWLSLVALLTFGVVFNSFCYLRQMIAAIICFYGFKYIKSKEFSKYFICVVLAASFHLSAYFMLPLYFIMQIRFNALWLGFYSAVLLATYKYSFYFMEFMTTYVYRSYDPITSYEATHGLPHWYVYPAFILFVVCLVFYKDLLKKNRMNVVYLQCAFFTIFWEVLGWKHAILSRMALFFIFPTYCLLLPSLVEVMKDKILSVKKLKFKKQFVAGMLSVVLVIMCGYYYALLKDNYNGVVPYMTYADEVINNE